MELSWKEAEAHRLRHKLGATYLGGSRCLFRVWARRRSRSNCTSLIRRIVGFNWSKPSTATGKRRLRMCNPAAGICTGSMAKRMADPASRFQPEGVHAASAVVDASFAWDDQHWFGVPLSQHVIYELHVGTYTKQGTFEAIIPHLARLKDLGVTAIELMPIAQFPGAAQLGLRWCISLRGAELLWRCQSGLKKLVNAAHLKGWRCCWMWYIITSGRKEITWRIRPVLYRLLQDAVGQRDQL